MSRVLSIIANLVLLDVGWFLAVVMASHLSAAICILFSLINIFILSDSKSKISFAVILVACVGILNDAAMAYLGFYVFVKDPSSIMTSYLAALWVLLASSYNISFVFFKRLNFIVTGLVGGVFGSCSYLLAARMGALQITNNSYIDMFVISFVNWFVIFPLTIQLFFKFENYFETKSTK